MRVDGGGKTRRAQTDCLCATRWQVGPQPGRDVRFKHWDAPKTQFERDRANHCFQISSRADCPRDFSSRRTWRDPGAGSSPAIGHPGIDAARTERSHGPRVHRCREFVPHLHDWGRIRRSGVRLVRGAPRHPHQPRGRASGGEHPRRRGMGGRRARVSDGAQILGIGCRQALSHQHRGEQAVRFTALRPNDPGTGGKVGLAKTATMDYPRYCARGCRRPYPNKVRSAVRRRSSRRKRPHNPSDRQMRTPAIPAIPRQRFWIPRSASLRSWSRCRDTTAPIRPLPWR